MFGIGSFYGCPLYGRRGTGDVRSKLVPVLQVMSVLL